MKNALRTNENYYYYYYYHEHDMTFYTRHWISFLTGRHVEQLLLSDTGVQ